MINRVFSRAICLAVCVCSFTGCLNTTYNPSSVSAEQWFSKKKSRKAKAAKPVVKQYSGNVHDSLLSQASGGNTSVVIDIGDQKGYLLVNGQIAASYPVSTARTGKHTPRGTFYITEKVRSGKYSTIYKTEMPFWMRLDQSAIGIHAGSLPGYPASAGCVRLNYDMARLMYDHTRSGTKVSIYNNWSGN